MYKTNPIMDVKQKDYFSWKKYERMRFSIGMFQKVSSITDFVQNAAVRDCAPGSSRS